MNRLACEMRVGSEVIGTYDLPDSHWIRLSEPGRGKCAVRLLHGPSGHVVAHCGHPTANWPWYIETAGGRVACARTGRAWAKQGEAKAAVEALHRGGAQLTEVDGRWCVVAVEAEA